jgi:hydrogenase expression/formation protein HypC
MCLAVPGKVIEIRENSLGMTMGRVSFGGIVKDVSLAYLPDVALGEYVVVHVGFAIGKINEEEAGQIFEFLKMNQELAELNDTVPTGERSDEYARRT